MEAYSYFLLFLDEFALHGLSKAANWLFKLVDSHPLISVDLVNRFLSTIFMEAFVGFVDCGQRLAQFYNYKKVWLH